MSHLLPSAPTASPVAVPPPPPFAPTYASGTVSQAAAAARNAAAAAAGKNGFGGTIESSSQGAPAGTVDKKQLLGA